MKFPGIGGEHTEACAPVDGGRLRYVRRPLPLLVASSNGDAGWYLSIIAGQSTTQNKMKPHEYNYLPKVLRSTRVSHTDAEKMRRLVGQTNSDGEAVDSGRKAVEAVAPDRPRRAQVQQIRAYRLTTLAPELPCAPLLIVWAGNRWKEDVTLPRRSFMNAECPCGTSSVGSSWMYGGAVCDVDPSTMSPRLVNMYAFHTDHVYA
ncbi:hypothetical protein SCP_0308450 [Sparassis crispa]|uniref:Uncharacterized protein n=1 Tax=Sparassis crispa TaxID=139825 RepID=A0A401GG26_9APHY|nr:hypothetical protein SCP_0308450 [Sparassis crispa]GBE81119.1 hypothetical protein SCP_0308450 [Sparassis crispa]